ncbi:MAG: hypothetical protein KF824_10495 [Fimbriimonadaceae bacterium]|nr:MAG: hypothetical protein KF824_10495 [Fimbriimonadaceae bacterium]
MSSAGARLVPKLDFDTSRKLADRNLSWIIPISKDVFPPPSFPDLVVSLIYDVREACKVATALRSLPFYGPTAAEYACVPHLSIDENPEYRDSVLRCFFLKNEPEIRQFLEIHPKYISYLDQLVDKVNNSPFSKYLPDLELSFLMDWEEAEILFVGVLSSSNYQSSDLVKWLVENWQIFIDDDCIDNFALGEVAENVKSNQ